MEAAMIPMFRDFNIGRAEIAKMIEEADDDKNSTIESAEFIEVLKKNQKGVAGFWGRLKLFDAIGGTAGVKSIVSKMYEKLKADEEMMEYFKGKNVEKIVDQ